MDVNSKGYVIGKQRGKVKSPEQIYKGHLHVCVAPSETRYCPSMVYL